MKTLAWMVQNHALFTKKPAAAASRRRIVVVEHSAESFERALDDAEFQETIVVAEPRADAAPNLALRVTGRIAQLEQQRTPAWSATFVLARRNDGQTAASRELVARSLLSHLRATGGSELAIVAPAPSGAERDDVLDLVDRLLSELDTQSITIRLKFSGSRVRRAAPEGTVTPPRALREAS